MEGERARDVICERLHLKASLSMAVSIFSALCSNSEGDALVFGVGDDELVIERVLRPHLADVPAIGVSGVVTSVLFVTSKTKKQKLKFINFRKFQKILIFDITYHRHHRHFQALRGVP